jgi:hypothetical protein
MIAADFDVMKLTLFMVQARTAFRLCCLTGLILPPAQPFRAPFTSADAVSQWSQWLESDQTADNIDSPLTAYCRGRLLSMTLRYFPSLLWPFRHLCFFKFENSTGLAFRVLWDLRGFLVACLTIPMITCSSTLNLLSVSYFYGKITYFC